MPAEYEKMTEFGLVWTATLDGPESVGQPKTALDHRAMRLGQLSHEPNAVSSLHLKRYFDTNSGACCCVRSTQAVHILIALKNASFCKLTRTVSSA
jgi:hypothetical protein